MAKDDLISRAALLYDLSYCAPELWQDEEYVKAKIMKQPTVDAAPVVRCKDCRYWYAEIGASTGWLPCQEIATERDWFCASGKRRDDDG